MIERRGLAKKCFIRLKGKNEFSELILYAGNVMEISSISVSHLNLIFSLKLRKNFKH